MLLSVLSEVTWNVAMDGRPRATTKSWSKEDIRQFLIVSINEVFRVLYFSSKRNKDGIPSYFISPTLSIQNFPLGDPDRVGKRIADMSVYDLFRLPHDLQFPNIFPKGCGDKGDDKSISLIEPGEEYFYAGKPEFKGYKFARATGRQMNTWHLPPCVTSIDVEASFNAPDLDPDISSDVAYDAANIVLGRFIGIPEFENMGTDNSLTPAKKILRQRIPQQSTQVQDA